MKAGEFLSMGRDELRSALASGHPIATDALVGHEYLGISLGLPGFVDRLLWKTFVKVFHRDEGADGVRGWNIRMQQRGLSGPHTPMEKKGGDPRTFGHFAVRPIEEYRVPRPCGPGVMLDYHGAGNPALDPGQTVRDALVAVNPGEMDLLLGWMYLQLGPMRVPTPSFFTLERLSPLRCIVAPPRPI